MTSAPRVLTSAAVMVTPLPARAPATLIEDRAAIGRPHLDDRGRGRRRVVDGDPSLRGGRRRRPPVAGVVALPFLELRRQGEPPVEGGGEVGPCTRSQSGRCVEGRRHLEAQQRHAGRRIRQGGGRSDGHPGQGQDAGNRGQQPRPVRRGHGQTACRRPAAGGRRPARAPVCRVRCRRPGHSAGGRPSRMAAVKSTSRATRPAFHGPHADGPVARLSASVRAASRSQGVAIADGRGHRRRRWPGHRGLGGWPLPAAAGGSGPASAGWRRRPRRDPVGAPSSRTTAIADLGVVAAAALADVVEEGAEQQ